MSDEFTLRVTEVLSRLEPGDVTTYGEVATEAGYPGAARAVGRLLSQSHGEWAWWRVVTSTGRLVPGSEIEHAKRLRAEGVPVEGNRVARMGTR
jgi:methylated-DNA-protein-cysteine methyltransferase-like protein